MKIASYEMRGRKHFEITDATMENFIFCNFAGNEARFNEAGKRNFNLIFDDENQARAFENEGCRVNVSPNPDGDGGPDTYRVKININENYAREAPELYLVNEEAKEKVLLTPAEYKTLDGVEFVNVSLDVVTSHYKTGTSLYLTKGYFVIRPVGVARQFEDYKTVNEASRAVSDEEEIPFD